MIESNCELTIAPVYYPDNMLNLLPDEVMERINHLLNFESRVQVLTLPLREWQWKIYYPLIKEVSEKISYSTSGIYIDMTKIASADTETIIIYYFTRKLVEESLNTMTWQSLDNYFNQKAMIEKTAKTCKTAYIRKIPASEKLSENSNFYSPLLKKIMDFEDRFFKEVMRNNHPFHYTVLNTRLKLKKISRIQLLTLASLVAMAYIIFFLILPIKNDS